MKDYALELAQKKSGHTARLNALREYIQAYLLRIMHDAGVFRSCAFIGGTALRFLYDLPRFSEDLDFSQVGNEEKDFRVLMKKIKAELQAAGYAVEIATRDHKAVHNASVKFMGLLHDAGLSPMKNQNLMIKIEIDTQPPQGAITRTDIINKYFPIAYLTYDLSSLFAGKINALLTREYTKGRDVYDIAWYLSKWKNIEPNMPFLVNALRQYTWQGEMPSAATWRLFLGRVINGLDWKKVTEDVHNFLERPEDMQIFSKDNLLALIGE